MNKKFYVEINTSNAAFSGMDCPVEVARIVRELADKVDNSTEKKLYILHDINGNKVGIAGWKN